MIIEDGIQPSILGGLRILLVEDEAMVAMLMESMLEALGCQSVKWVAPFQQLCRLSRGAKSTGALLDVNLGGTAESIQGRCSRRARSALRVCHRVWEDHGNESEIPFSCGLRTVRIGTTRRDSEKGNYLARKGIKSVGTVREFDADVRASRRGPVPCVRLSYVPGRGDCAVRHPS